MTTQQSSKSPRLTAINFLELLRVDPDLKPYWFESEDFWKILISRTVSLLGY